MSRIASWEYRGIRLFGREPELSISLNYGMSWLSRPCYHRARIRREKKGRKHGSSIVRRRRGGSSPFLIGKRRFATIVSKR